jgi:hypothetical protein
MKLHRFLFAVIASAFLFVLVVSTTTAGSSGNGWFQRRTLGKRILIASVDVKAGTVEFEFTPGTVTRSYSIGPSTRISVINPSTAKATIDQIEVGMQVFNAASQDGRFDESGLWASGCTLTNIMVGRARPAPKPPN